jgi:phosphoadenosine phosphosulfate reductase
LNLFVTTSAITPNRMLALYGELWNEDHSSYGRMRKVEPLRGAIRDLDVRCLLVGLRGNQTKHRASLPALSVRGVRANVVRMLRKTNLFEHRYSTTR